MDLFKRLQYIKRRVVLGMVTAVYSLLDFYALARKPAFV